MTEPLDRRSLLADGAAINSFRIAKGWNVEHLIGKTKSTTAETLSESTVKRALAGKKIRLSNLRAIADALGVGLAQVTREQIGDTEIQRDFEDPFRVAEDATAGFPSFELVPQYDKYFESGTADSFYDGFPPTWADLRAGFDIQREASADDSTLRRAISRYLETAGLSVISITGAAGSGKTTILHRVGFDLANRNVTVVRLKQGWHSFPVSLAEQISTLSKLTSNPLLVLIDKAGDLTLEHGVLASTLREVRFSCPDNAIVVVCADETNRWASDVIPDFRPNRSTI